MTYTPAILGALSCALVTGAAIGQNIGTDPIGVRADVSDLLPQPALYTASADRSGTRPRLPDHYPLETPEGRIEISELAFHGRLRNRPLRYARGQASGNRHASAVALLDAQQPEPPRQPAVPPVAAPPAQLATPTPATQPAPLELEQPVTLAQTSAAAPQPPQAVSINVAAELSQQR